MFNKPFIPASVIFLLFIAIASCSKDRMPEVSVADDLESTLTQVPEGFDSIPFPEDNPFSLEKWKLGKALFYDPALSVDFSKSCASCHHAELAFTDNQPTSKGVEDRDGTRNSPSLANVAYQPYFMREGAVPTLEMQVLVPIQEHNEFAYNIVELCERLNEMPDYVQMTQDAFGTEMTPFALTRALATFERTLISGNSPYDQFKRGKATLSASELRGMDLFFSDRTQCASCHSGVNFTDYSIRNNGYESGDVGRMRLTNDSADYSLFKIPSLRNIALTDPYMHDGSFSTLRKVMDNYNAGGSSAFSDPLIRPLHLTETELNDLIQFLHTLTDEEFISNPIFKE